MGIGYLKIETTTAFDALPVHGAQVEVRSVYGQILVGLTTDESGAAGPVALSAPDAVHTLSPEDTGPYYSVCTVAVTAQGFQPVTVHGVQIFDGQTSILPVELAPAARGELPVEITLPENHLHNPEPRQLQGPADFPGLRRTVVIPETITVHLGAPSSNARNVRVRFADYIKNVASGEIYPTWPQAALEANIYCQISFALNRVYTEWYVSRGYPFHITSSTAYDQSYADGRNIFSNISALVDNIFSTFVRRQGHGEPYFTQYCNGTTVTCRGLSQWGTVPLANQGRSAFQILQNYYPSDIRLVTTDQIAGIQESYPGSPHRQGSRGESVRHLQTYLNRIRVNYPAIPQIPLPNGSFGADTTAAVRAFQGIFSLAVDGVVGRATWYKVLSIYTGVKKLADLDSEGERIGIGATPPATVLREGSKGGDVVQLQFLLNMAAQFYNDIPEVLENSLFDSLTRQSVLAFQRRFGLSADGIVGPATWSKLYEVYHSIESTLPEQPGGGSGGAVLPAYPGALLRNGSRGENVVLMQRYLNAIFRGCPGYTSLAEDGIFGAATGRAVIAFQTAEGLSPDGIIGPLTWNAIVAAYQSLA